MNGQTKSFKIRIVLFAVVSCAFLALSYLHIPSDNGIYDRFLRLRAPRLAQSNVFLWSMDETTLEKYGKWPFMPEDMERLADFIAKASPAQVLVDGSVFGLENTGRIPARIPIFDAQKFLASLTPDKDGVYRSFATRTVQGPSLAVTAAANMEQKDLSEPEAATLQVNFSGLGVRYPTVQLYKIIQDEFRTEIFSGKTVIIGNTDRNTATGLVSPFWPGDGAMPQVEFLAEAITTMAAGKAPAKTIFHLDVLLPWLFAFGLFFFGLRISFAKELLIWTGGLVAIFTLQYLAFSRLDMIGQVLLPALMFITLANSSIILRLSGIKAGTEELISSFNFRTGDLTFQPAVSSDEEIWEDLARLAAIYLDADFQAFYQINPKSQEIHSVYSDGRRCPDTYFVHSEPGDAPFAEASRRNNPMETVLPGMETAGFAEASILAPLRHKGILYGYWGLMRMEAFPSIQDHVLNRIVSHLADEMGKRLALLKNLNQPKESLSSLLDKDRIERRILGLDDLVRTFERNERFFSFAFSNMPDGIVIFNLSGQILYFNEQAQKGLRRFSLAVTDPDFFETVRILSRSREEIFKTRLVSLLSGSEAMTFEARTPAGQVWSVSVYPIIDQESGHPTALIAKMTDVTDMVLQRNMRTKVIHAFFGALKALIHQTNDSLASQSVKAAFTGARRPLLDTIRGQIGGILHLLARFEKQLAGQMSKDLTVIGPMDIALLVREIVTSKSDEANAEDIRLELNLPGEDILAMGNRSVLSHAVEFLLEMSISNSMEGSDIWISVEEKDDQILLTISDSGIGFPSDYAPGHGVRTELGEIESALTHIGGKFSADSNLGRGARFEITLPKVI